MKIIYGSTEQRGGVITTKEIWLLTILPWASTLSSAGLAWLGQPDTINLAIGFGLFAIISTTFAATCSLIDWYVKRGQVYLSNANECDRCGGVHCWDEDEFE